MCPTCSLTLFLLILGEILVFKLSPMVFLTTCLFLSDSILLGYLRVFFIFIFISQLLRSQSHLDGASPWCYRGMLRRPMGSVALLMLEVDKPILLIDAWPSSSLTIQNTEKTNCKPQKEWIDHRRKIIQVECCISVTYVDSIVDCGLCILYRPLGVGYGYRLGVFLLRLWIFYLFYYALCNIELALKLHS